jgi:hypothetical protein
MLKVCSGPRSPGAPGLASLPCIGSWQKPEGVGAPGRRLLRNRENAPTSERSTSTKGGGAVNPFAPPG